MKESFIHFLCTRHINISKKKEKFPVCHNVQSKNENKIK